MTNMKIKHIKENLCYYDKRNPYYMSGKKEKVCYCDSCFHHNTELAEELLRLHETIKKLKGGDIR